MNNRRHHLYEQLLDYAEGRLPPTAAQALRLSIAADPVAAAELAAITRLIALMRSDRGEDAPEYMVRRALRLVPQRRPGPAERPLRRIAAALLRDSWQAPRAVGLRSELPSPRDLVYVADECMLDLQIIPSGGRWQLRGQILGPEEDGIVELAGAAPPIAAMINMLGEFTLPPLSAGRYALNVRQRSRLIIVETLELGPSPA